MLAVVESIRHFKPYLSFNKFLLRTDHQALTALKNTKNSSSLLFRWSLFLSEFEFDIEYIKGDTNPADALSRKSICSIIDSNITVIVDDDIKNQIITYYHLYLAHGGISSMIYNIKKKYFWNGMFVQIKKYVDSCIDCQKSANCIRNNSYKMAEVSEIGELVELDIVGPLPISSYGSKFIITFINHYSKFAIAKAIPAKSAFCVRDFLDSKIAKGFPYKIKTILSDNGLEFKSEIVQEYARIKEFVWKFGAPYHPQSQGLVERFNGSLIRKLKKLCSYGSKSWANRPNMAVNGYNYSFSRPLGCSPIEIISGNFPLFIIDKKLLPEKFNNNISLSKLKNLKNSISER